MKKDKKSILGPFDRLKKSQQTLIRLDFEGNHTNASIASEIGRKNSETVSRWRAQEWYEVGMADYINRQIKTGLKRQALQTTVKLLNANSEMVRLQAATTLLKMAGMLSDNDTPELTRAKIRKANAEADIAERKAEQLTNNVADDLTINIVRNDRSVKDGKADND